MHEVYQPWIWMFFPIVVLVFNLVWPRSRRLKITALVIFVFAAWLQDLNPLDRVVNLAERILKREQTGTPEQIISNLRIAQGWAHETLFYVKLCFTIAVMVAMIPTDILPRFCSRRAAPDKSLPPSATPPLPPP